MQAKERMMKIVQRIIEERINYYKNNKDCVTNDVVDVLLQDKGDSNTIPNIWLKNMSENIIEMMIPGEETLPTAMTMAVKFLSDSPLALSKLVVCLFVYNLNFILLFMHIIFKHFAYFFGYLLHTILIVNFTRYINLISYSLFFYKQIQS
jgi:hypothetical protein